MRKSTFLILIPLALAFAASARADEIYDFSFTQTGGNIKSFEFSFTVPTYVTAGNPPAFTPFTVTDGTNNWTINTDVAIIANGSAGCMQFGTLNYAELLTSTCGGDALSAGAGLMQFYFNGGFPSVDGIYTPYFNADFYQSFLPEAISFEQALGNLQLTIIQTPVPEASSGMLLLLAVGFMACRRIVAAAWRPNRRIT